MEETKEEMAGLQDQGSAHCKDLQRPTFPHVRSAWLAEILHICLGSGKYIYAQPNNILILSHYWEY